MSVNGPRRVVIAGGGLAGARTAQALRNLGYDGALTLLCAEQRAPYDRPPLSKDFLKTPHAENALDLIPAERYAALGIDLVLGDPARAIDPAQNVVHTEHGRSYEFDALVVATGARARELPVFAGAPAVTTLRSMDDAIRLRAALDAKHRVTVIGGGFIGLEVAATARAAGCPVTVVEALAAPLVGVLGDQLAGWLRRQHEENGVEFRCGVTVESLSSADGSTVLVLSDGSEVHTDIVVVGVGITRDTEWLSTGGLEVHLGLVCDDAGRTNRPGVFGAGDIVCRHVDGECSQIQHWTAATVSTRKVAHAVLGLDSPAVPDDAFFWSDQYDLRIQFVGTVGAGATVEYTSGDPESRAFTAAFTGPDGTTRAAFGVNSQRDFIRLRARLNAPAPTLG